MKKGIMGFLKFILLLTVCLSVQTSNAQITSQQTGRSLNFSGSINRVRGPVGLIPATGQPYTFQVWARYSPALLGGQVCIAAQSRNFYISQSPLGKIILGDGDTTNTDFPQDEDWHQYTVVNKSDDFLFMPRVLPNPHLSPPISTEIPAADFILAPTGRASTSISREILMKSRSGTGNWALWK
jgi:hypothetical protein